MLLIADKAAKALLEARRAAFFGIVFLLAGVVRMRSGRDVEGDIRPAFAVQLDGAIGFDGRSHFKVGVGADVVEDHGAVIGMDAGFHNGSLV